MHTVAYTVLAWEPVLLIREPAFAKAAELLKLKNCRPEDRLHHATNLDAAAFGRLLRTGSSANVRFGRSAA